MKIKKVHIKKFRGFQNESIELGAQITAIAGQNGTQKSTLLGIITQVFTVGKGDEIYKEKPLSGGNYRSAFKEKFRLSPIFDKPKHHEWTLVFENENIPDFTVESMERSSGSLRFWKKGSKEKGDGYIHLPTIFLSLKRLIPVAEDSKVKTDENLLTEEELKEFKKLHNKILITQTEITSTTAITSTNKQSLGVTTDQYDWNQNSMGQDNLGKIILALFSFKRLKKKYPNSYKGGILAIDEIDATMYPASQVELLNVLRKYASQLKLQIIFTTHSISLLKAVDNLIKETSKKIETLDQVKLLYLKKIDNQIKIKQDVDITAILLDLNVVAEGDSRKKYKITVYTEDVENKLFVKAILKSKANSLNFIDSTMSCSTLIELVCKKIPAFSYPFSIIILDGDVKQDKAQYKKIVKFDNVLILPGNDSPERLIATFLYNLSDADIIWNKIAKGYTKQVCFRDYSLEDICGKGEASRQTAKKWFNSQLRYWGSTATKVLNPYLDSIQEEKKEFVSSYEELMKKYIHD